MGKPAVAAKPEPKKQSAKEAAKKKVEKEESDEEEEEEEELQWWEQENIEFAQRGDKRWDTLEHNGVLFPPPYVPHGIPVYYGGAPFKMTPEEEEIATMFASAKEAMNYKHPLFRKNFWQAWKAVLDKRGAHPIKSLELVDFEPIWQWFVAEREKKRNMSKEEKKAIKDAINKEVEPYKYCLWNGKKEQVANYRVEPPGLFRGRGEHPLQGSVKKRITPEDVTINIGADAKVPTPPAGHHWGEVRHDNTVTWLAMWKDAVTDSHKYVMLAAASTVKGMSDMMKFEKARKLTNIIDDIRQKYRTDFYSKSLMERQRAVCCYFIDKLALRVGNEKGEDEAETVGCCSLRVQNVVPTSDTTLHFDFLGKDSIRFENTVEVEPRVVELIKEFRRGKHQDDDIFDEVSTSSLNDHFKNFMPGLTAKVFRTYNASKCLQDYFKANPVDVSMNETDKLLYFNNANTKVALLCNHQRTVSKTHASSMKAQAMKMDYIKATIERLQKLKDIKDRAKAAKKFFEEEDKLQLEWLDQYGTPEQKEDFKKIVEKRDKKSFSGSLGSTSKPKVEEDVKPTKKGVAATATATKGKTEAPKKRGRSVKEEDSSDDETLSALVAERPQSSKGKKSVAPPPKKAAKVESPKKVTLRKAKKEEDSDDDVPIGKLKK